MSRSAAGGLSVNAFPTSDAVLAERVREIIDEIGDVENDVLIAALTARLRPVYPAASVQLQSGLAGLGTMTTIYVFRDGGVQHGDRSEAWIEDASTALVVSDAEGRYVDANDAAARLFGTGRSEIVGRRAGEFTRPDVRIKDAAALWQALEATGRLHSLAVVVRADGTETRVEFLTVRDGDGPGRNVTYLRPIEYSDADVTPAP
jgi:PAS domain S-box-containing protein